MEEQGIYRKYAFEESLATLVIVILGFLLLTQLVAPSILAVEAFIMVIAVFSIAVVTDALVTWMILLGFGLSVISLVFGVDYLSSLAVLILEATFPIVLFLALRVNRARRVRFAPVKVEYREARNAYNWLHGALAANQSEGFQALLIHWAHNEQFWQISAKEFAQMIARIHGYLNTHVTENEKVYYLGKGHMLILSSEVTDNLEDRYLNEWRQGLTEFHFQTRSSERLVQYQRGYLKFNQTNLEKFAHFADATKNLERQLETDIIVEY